MVYLTAKILIAKEKSKSTKNFLAASLLILSTIVISHSSEIKAQVCKPCGLIRGRNHPPCNQENDSECCLPGKSYAIYRCSPSVSNSTKAVLTLNSFPSGGEIPTACDNKYRRDYDHVVALSTGWFNRGDRCLHNFTISANGQSVTAKVVDECDSTMGCDADHDYQPPCRNDVVDASIGVWKALGVPENKWGELDINWSDASP